MSPEAQIRAWPLGQEVGLNLTFLWLVSWGRSKVGACSGRQVSPACHVGLSFLCLCAISS